MWTDRPVTEEIAIRLETLAAGRHHASIFAVFACVPLGTTAALMRGTWVDYAVRIITIAACRSRRLVRMLIMITLLYLFNWLPPITFSADLCPTRWRNLAQLVWPAMGSAYRYCAVSHA